MLGYEAYAKTCDVSNRKEVRSLAEFAESFGEIRNVIHAAGLSPAMADPEKLLRVNALGTMYVNQEFSDHMKKGSVILDVSSNSAYVLPGIGKSNRSVSGTVAGKNRWSECLRCYFRQNSLYFIDRKFKEEVQ